VFSIATGRREARHEAKLDVADVRGRIEYTGYSAEEDTSDALDCNRRLRAWARAELAGRSTTRPPQSA
jgi:hypothetical protein